MRPVAVRVAGFRQTHLPGRPFAVPCEPVLVVLAAGFHPVVMRGHVPGPRGWLPPVQTGWPRESTAGLHVAAAC